jgi:hypothetical protein
MKFSLFHEDGRTGLSYEFPFATALPTRPQVEGTTYNIVARSFNHCCRGNATTLFVFFAQSLKRYDFRKNLFEDKMCFDFFCTT